MDIIHNATHGRNPIQVRDAPLGASLSGPERAVVVVGVDALGRLRGGVHEDVVLRRLVGVLEGLEGDDLVLPRREVNPEVEGAVDDFGVAVAVADGGVVGNGRRGLHGRQLVTAIHVSWFGDSFFTNPNSPYIVFVYSIFFLFRPSTCLNSDERCQRCL